MIDINMYDPWTLVAIAVLNPAVIVIAIYLGRTADQWQKLPIAALAASLAGMALYWLGGQVGLFAIHALGGEGAIFIVQCIAAFVWASLAYLFFRSK